MKSGCLAHADDELRRSSADVYDDRRLHGAGTAGHRTEERHPGLFLARENARIQAALVADARGELPPVARVAHRRGHHREVPVGLLLAVGRRVGVDLLAELGQRASTRSQPSSDRDPPASTPAPSRVTTERRTISTTSPSGVTSAISRRVEFVPMSTTAARMRLMLLAGPVLGS